MNEMWKKIKVNLGVDKDGFYPTHLPKTTVIIEYLERENGDFLIIHLMTRSPRNKPKSSIVSMKVTETNYELMVPFARNIIRNTLEELLS